MEDKLVLDAVLAQSSSERAALWKLREDQAEAISASARARRC